MSHRPSLETPNNTSTTVLYGINAFGDNYVKLGSIYVLMMVTH